MHTFGVAPDQNLAQATAHRWLLVIQPGRRVVAVNRALPVNGRRQ